MHQLSSEKMSFSMAICHKCLEHPVVFPADLFFLKQLASHVSVNTLQLKFPGMKFFPIHPGNLNIFLEGFKVLHCVKGRQVIIHIKKIEK